MIAPDVIARRLLALSDALRELERSECRDGGKLQSDAMLRAAVERWLQVAIEACIDVASHVLASEGWTPAVTARAAFATLATHGRIDPDLAARLGSAAGLRNILVHDYANIDVARLAAIVANDLDDLRTFATIVATWT